MPPGRYLVRINSAGPEAKSPYNFQYYPSGVRRENARVLELAARQRMADIDFQAPLLPEGTTRVRVTWANGTPAAGAGVCVAYAYADDYESMLGKHCISPLDRNGVAVIHLYGKSQVRIFAILSIDRDKGQLPETLRSGTVEVAADRTQDNMSLILISVKH